MVDLMTYRALHRNAQSFCNAVFVCFRSVVHWLDDGLCTLLTFSQAPATSPASICCCVPGKPRGTYCIIAADGNRSVEHTSELQSLMRNSYAVFCLKNKKDQS